MGENEEKSSNYYYYLKMAAFENQNVHSAMDIFGPKSCNELSFFTNRWWSTLKRAQFWSKIEHCMLYLSCPPLFIDSWILAVSAFEIRWGKWARYLSKGRPIGGPGRGNWGGGEGKYKGNSTTPHHDCTWSSFRTSFPSSVLSSYVCQEYQIGQTAVLEHTWSNCLHYTCVHIMDWRELNKCILCIKKLKKCKTKNWLTHKIV